MASRVYADDTDDEVVTDAEREHFLTQGFVVPRVGLPPADTTRLQSVVEDVFRENPNWQNLLRMPHLPKRDGQSEGVVGGERLFEFAIHPVILEAARRLIGPNLIMWGAEIFAKPAAVGKPTPWHQDSYTPAIKAGPGQARPRSVMLWIAVDPVDKGNGCLRFIPGSGRAGVREHAASDENMLLSFAVDRKSIDETQAVDAVLAPGQFSGHDLFVVHGANANTSGRRRAGITFHYMAAEDVYDRSFGNARGTGIGAKPAPIAERPIWLVLGENVHPGNDFVTGHKGLEALDAQAEAMRLRLNREFA